METVAQASPATTITVQTVAKPLPIQKRIASVDVYRGLVMLLMMAEVLSFEHVSRSLPGNAFWQFFAFNQEHVAWTGCSLHDLIQPSFSFLVGVALPFSIASRKAKGASFASLLKHALVRSLILICLGIFLRSMWAKQTYFTFEDTLTQIGLGYTFLFLLGFCSRKVQIITLVVILFGYWLLFALYPLPSSGFDYSVAGVTPGWEHNLQGLAAHWNKNTNAAWAFDRWFLNLFPREHVFNNNDGGYATLSFIPTLGTMILGLLAGSMLKRKTVSDEEVAVRFELIGLALIVAGLVLHYTGINPIVKRIWSPAWVLFSGGCSFILLALFYYIIDVKNHKKWSFPLMIIGMNSIAAYVIAHVTTGFIRDSFSIHLGSNYNMIFGSAYSTLIEGGLILLTQIWILYWMYKNKLFIKI